jgi:hypothetical protein
VFNVDAQVPPIPTFIDQKTGDVVRAELKVDEVSNLSFKLKVENNGTRPLSTVTVRVFDNYVDDKGQQVRWNFFNFTTPPIAVGDRYILGERPFSPTNPPLYWWANVTGDHTLEFKVFYDAQAEQANDISYVTVTVEAKATDDDPLVQTAYMGMIIAIIVAAIIVVGYVFALRRKPQVDADLYSSIYGADFEDEAMAMEDGAAPAAEDTGMTAEQQALYGDDYVGEGEYAEGEYAEGEYDYDYEDGEYEYEDGEYEYEDGEYEYEDGEYAEGEYAEGEYAEGETTEGEATKGEYDETYYEGEYDEDTDADYEEENSPEELPRK